MSLVAALTLAAIGIVLLGGGGELLVRGATSLARLARVTPAVIGLTIVAMRTSLPAHRRQGATISRCFTRTRTPSADPVRRFRSASAIMTER